MGRPFWTTGPVPPGLLGELALRRPLAEAALGQALDRAGAARLGGSAGSGRTTLVAQLALALGRRALVLDAGALLQGTEEEALAWARREAGPKAPGDWPGLLRALGPGAFLAVDGLDQRPMPWADRLADAGIPLLLVGGEGVAPDRIHSASASSFLERRAARARLAWTAAALREAVAFADGRPDRLQAVGATCLHVALEAGRRRITVDDYLEGALEVAEWPRGRDALQGLAGPRLDLLKAAVREPAGGPTSWALRCGLDPAAAVVHLGRLVADGWMARPARGRYVVADPAVALHLQARRGTAARIVGPAGPPTPGGPGPVSPGGAARTP